MSPLPKKMLYVPCMIEFRKRLFLFYVGAFTVVYLVKQLAAEQDTVMAKATLGLQTLITYIN